MFRSMLALVAVLAWLGWPAAAVGAVLPEPEPTTQPSSPIIIYRPIGTFTSNRDFDADDAGSAIFLNEMDRVFSQVTVPVELRALPLRRAFSLYEADKEGCLMAPPQPDSDHEINSRPIASVQFWLYVMAGRGFKSRADLHSYGTLDGADELIGKEILPGLDRRLAPNFKVLKSMLVSGRVDAVPMGAYAVEVTGPLPEGMVRLDNDPVIFVTSGLRCKVSPRTRHVIEQINNIVGENIPTF